MRAILFFAVAWILTACSNEIPFDSELWNTKGIDWQLDDTRERMVNDLISSDTLLNLNSQEIYKLLGEPSFVEENKLLFLLREKYYMNIDPEYVSYLVIEMSEDQFVQNVYIQTFK